MKRQGQSLSLKTLTKNNVWEIQENDIFRLWSQAERDSDFKENRHRYMDVIKSAFMVEEIKLDRPEILKKYQERGFKTNNVRMDDHVTVKWAIKKKPILRVTDLTMENIHHISAHKLIKVLERNFGGGWDSLSKSVQNIIQSAFDVTTTTMPTNRIKNPGGLYEKKCIEGYEVLEIPKGGWTEAIFVRDKMVFELPPEEEEEKVVAAPEKPKESPEEKLEETVQTEPLPAETESTGQEEEDDSFDDEKLTEESYRTTYETNPEDLEMQAEEVTDEEEF